MRWDRLFEDLEDQLASEWEAERAALDSEAERLRLSRLPLQDRLRTLIAREADAGGAAVELVDGTVLSVRMTAVGADWIGVDGTTGQRTAGLIPFGAVGSIALPTPEILLSARPDVPMPPQRRLAERMTLGFVLRDLARRRLPVTLHLVGGASLSGTIDRALHDHLDLALHDAGAPRRSGAVTGMRIVPFAALGWLRLDSSATVA
jgi:hypothetical protein